MINGIIAGREDSYALLFEEYYRPLTVFASRFLEDIEISKEIVQDLFVHLYENRRRLQITSSLRSYMFQSVRNRCLNHLKHEKIEKAHFKQLSREKQSSEDLEDQMAEIELEERIFKIVSSLPPRCREIFMLSRVQGLKNNEIAARMDISIRTVETQISNALKTLRNNLGADIFPA
jgi:RNA polymerase sigma-70 factor (ECF subfamily)